MPEIHRHALLPYTREQMFDLVLDVRSYPEFLPHCTETRVLCESDREITASMTLQRLGMRQTLTTRNRLLRPGSISLELVSGPLRRFQGEWCFKSLDSGSRVDLSLAFEMQGGLPGRALAGLIRPLAAQMVDVFCRRAEQIYAG